MLFDTKESSDSVSFYLLSTELLTQPQFGREVVRQELNKRKFLQWLVPLLVSRPRFDRHREEEKMRR